MKKLVAAIAILATACAAPAVILQLPLPAITMAPSSAPTYAPQWCPPVVTLAFWPSAVKQWTYEKDLPAEGLDKLLSSFKSTSDIANWLYLTHYDGDYDLSLWRSPASFYTLRSGDCTAYARFWCLALKHLGKQPRLFALASTNSGHAVVLFLEPSGWSIASNAKIDAFSPAATTPAESAAVLTAAAGYKDNWREVIEVDIESGIALSHIQRRPQ